MQAALIGAVGLVWALAVGAGFGALEISVGYAFSSFLGGPLPLATMLIGLCAALCFVFLTLGLRRRLGPSAGPVVVFLGVAAYAAFNASQFVMVAPEGALTFDDFWARKSALIESATLERLVGGVPAEPLGAWGYALEALFLLGYPLGAWLLVFLARRIADRLARGVDR